MKHNDSSRPPSIRTVVFDFGGVFTESPIAAARQAAIRRGVDPEALIELMLGDYGRDSDHPWQRVERGELSLDEVRIWACVETKRQFGVEIDPMDVMEALMEAPIRPCMVQLVEDLRSHGLNTALLTNNAKELRKHWEGLADWASLFHAVVDSSQIGVRKPSPEAFRFALDGCREADPTRALMIDDFTVNVIGAESIGMHGVLVGEDPAPAIASIRQLVLS